MNQSRKSIEDGFPIEVISEIADRESYKKEVYNPISYIHKWWAKRISSVFRAIILGSILDESNNLMDSLYTKHNFGDTVVYDPFMGSGTSVTSAIKLGCRVIGRDINPVAYIMVKAGIQSYDKKQVELEYKKIEGAVKKKIHELYTTRLSDGSFATVLYYFWVKTINCPHCKTEIELFDTRIFSKNAVPSKDSSARAICPSCSSINHIHYKDETTICKNCGHSYNPQKGVADKGRVICSKCNNDFKIVDVLKNNKEVLKDKMYAKMVINKDGKKEYLPVNNYDLQLYQKSVEEIAQRMDFIPDEQITNGYNTNQVLKYNFNFWNQMFNARQLLCHSYLLEEIRKINNYELKELFTCLFSGMLEFNNMFTTFKGEGTGAIRHMFYNHILKPELMPLEGNVWGTSKSSGAFSVLYKSRILKALDYKSNPFELKLDNSKGQSVSVKVNGIDQSINKNIVDNYKAFQGDNVYLSVGDSSKTDIDSESVDLIITDPPFFDNVHYSELADFFYVWIKKILNHKEYTLPISTRSDNEVQDTEAENFSSKLENVLLECKRVLKKDGLLVFTYHHSKVEGWTSLYKAIRKAGFYITNTQPVKSEFSNSVPVKKSNTPIHFDLIIVCRKIDGLAPITKKSIDFDELNLKTMSILNRLKRSSIELSLGDKMIIQMGAMLSNLRYLNDLEKELKFLDEYVLKIDEYIGMEKNI